MREPTFLLGLAIAGGTMVLIVKMIANAFTARRVGRPDSDLSELREELDQHAAALEETQHAVAELQNRLDFTERMLAQARERPALGAGDRDK